MSIETPFNICEIFLSIQGESSFAGLPCVIVRTAGCPLRCTWCDTSYAFSDGIKMTTQEVVSKTMGFDVPYVEVTGGEPLVQKNIFSLLRQLCDYNKIVLLETCGAIDISEVDPRVHIIMDIKCPSSGEQDKMLWTNIELLKSKDELKFVIADRKDYDFACRVIRDHNLNNHCQILLSTVFDKIKPQQVVEWMLADRLQARFQLQMHKFIWPSDKKGV